jgi:predicted flap endonuclease-1-like 5' DNA nuclease
MANTVTRSERRTYERTSGSNSPTYYRVLAVLLLMGLIVAVTLGLLGQTGPGIMDQEAANMTLFVLVYLIVFVLALFLLRIGEILDVDKRVKTVLAQANDREMAMRASYAQMQQELARTRQLLQPIPVGDEHNHVIQVEGIGPVFATRLNSIGIITTDQLLAANPGDVAGRIDATPELVTEWQDMAGLMRLKGIGPQIAELLVRSGVRTPDALAKESPEHLSRMCTQAMDGKKVRITNIQVTPAVVKRWIDSARGRPDDAPKSPSSFSRASASA